jgi:hypothetical protein
MSNAMDQKRKEMKQARTERERIAQNAPPIAASSAEPNKPI